MSELNRKDLRFVVKAFPWVTGKAVRALVSHVLSGEVTYNQKTGSVKFATKKVSAAKRQQMAQQLQQLADGYRF